MTDQNLFNDGFPTNRIPLTLPSSGQSIFLRETTVVELKSMCKTIIDNLGRRQMDVIYDALTDYLQSMILTKGIDVWKLTEFDRLFCLMVFFQMSFYKEPISYKCPKCGVDINYRYDMSKYLVEMEQAFVDDQTVSIIHKSRRFDITIGWPSVRTMSKLTHNFYSESGNVTEESERTQFGINFILSFIKRVQVVDSMSEVEEANISFEELTWSERMDIINSIPSMVVFNSDDGLFSKITGYFINRVENCFKSETCPQCQADTYYGLSQSSHFYGLLYGSLKNIYGYILQVECLMVFRYDCCIFDKEMYMTYNDLNSLVHQIGVTAEKENNERRQMGNEPLYKGLFYIREILNNLVFPQDKKH